MAKSGTRCRSSANFAIDLKGVSESWIIRDMGLNGRSQVWMFYGIFWRYDNREAMVGATQLLIGPSVGRSKLLTFGEIRAIVSSEAARMRLPECELHVYVGKLYELRG